MIIWPQFFSVGPLICFNLVASKGQEHFSPLIKALKVEKTSASIYHFNWTSPSENLFQLATTADAAEAARAATWLAFERFG